MTIDIYRLNQKSYYAGELKFMIREIPNCITTVSCKLEELLTTSMEFYSSKTSYPTTLMDYICSIHLSMPIPTLVPADNDSYLIPYEQTREIIRAVHDQLLIHYPELFI